jgi:hypothetical protein
MFYEKEKGETVLKFLLHRSVVYSKNKTVINKNEICFTSELNLFRHVHLKKMTLKDWYVVDINGDNVDVETTDSGTTRILTDVEVDLDDSNAKPLNGIDRTWKKIPGFSKYMASERGEILTIKTGYYTKGVSAGHYLKVALIADGDKKARNYYVHRLIATAFNGKPKDNTYVVMHLDDNKFNNRADNLRWDTQSENIKQVWAIRKQSMLLNNPTSNIVEESEELTHVDTGDEFEHYDIQHSTNSDNENVDYYWLLTTLLENIPDLNVYFKANGVTENIITDAFDNIYSTVTNFGMFVQTGFVKIIDHFDDLIQGFSTVTSNADWVDNSKRLQYNKKQVIKLIDKVKWFDVYEQEVPTILGMNKSLIATTKSLRLAGEHIRMNLKNSLNYLDDNLSDALSNDEFRQSTKLLKKNERPYIDHGEQLRKYLSEFTTDDKTDRKQLKDIMNRNSELLDSSENMVAVLDLIDLVKVGGIERKLATARVKLDKLYKLMSSNSEYSLTSISSENFANITGDVAKYVTVSMVTLTAIYTVIGMLNNIYNVYKENK